MIIHVKHPIWEAIETKDSHGGMSPWILACIALVSLEDANCFVKSLNIGEIRLIE